MKVSDFILLNIIKLTPYFYKVWYRDEWKLLELSYVKCKKEKCVDDENVVETFLTENQVPISKRLNEWDP